MRIGMGAALRPTVQKPLRRPDGCHAEDLVDDTLDWRRGVDDDAVRGVFSRLVQPLDELAFRLSSAPLVFIRASSRRFSVSRSTLRTKTPSNRPMKSAEFREPPQKNVSASAWSATKALTLSTCQRWCSCGGSQR